jgi:signal transduction histidine kinase
VRGSAAGRLRRLRLLLTLFLTGINAAGLIIFAALAIANDASHVPDKLDGDLSRVTSTVSRLLQFDHTLLTQFVAEDQINTECPQFAVLPGPDGHFTAYYSAKQCVRVDPAVLGGLASAAATAGRSAEGYVDGPTGELLRVDAEPIQGATGGQYIGAIVAVTDAGLAEDAHDQFAWLVSGGVVLVIGLLALISHLISGRLIRPAAAALEQQEILIAETAHDLRNPVAALRALAEVALHDPAQRDNMLPRTLSLATRMGDVIDSLLVRARLAAGIAHLERQPVWLDQLVTAVVADTLTEGASITVSAVPTQAIVDPKLVQRAVGNLLDNALKHGRKPDRAAIVHVTVADGRVTIADEGPGIADDIAANLLDRFRTGSGSTGLGLSIVSWIAEAHRGSLNIYNAENGGAIFELVFPTN